MKAVILSIGDELVLGQTVDTNSAWMSQQLAAIGCPCLAHLTVADDQKMIELAIREIAPRCDVLLVSGGLGPTEDDLTRQALAGVLGVPLEMNPTWITKLESFFRARNRPMTPSNRIQAMLPVGSRMIDNTCGTACGMAATVGDCQVYVVPGVPHEMKAMFTLDILPHLTACSNGAVILSRTLHTFGLGESMVGERLGKLMDRTRNPSVGTTVSGGIVSLRINARFPSIEQAQRELEATDVQCRQALGDLIYGQDGISLQEVVGKMLADQRQTVATAESCTGGLLAGMFTDVPGSSAYFRQGWVTYTNDAKMQQLGVRPETLEKYGAVSEQTVCEMAQGARNAAGTDFALSISGIAGPDGGTPEKPVGTVCVGLAHAGGVRACRIIHTGTRDLVRDRACKTALTLLRYHLMGKELPF